MKENHAFTIEGAVPEDAEELVAIYDYYVQNTAITFEYETPTAAEFRRRIENTLSCGRTAGSWAMPMLGRFTPGRPMIGAVRPPSICAGGRQSAAWAGPFTRPWRRPWDRWVF